MVGGPQWVTYQNGAKAIIGTTIFDQKKLVVVTRFKGGMVES